MALNIVERLYKPALKETREAWALFEVTQDLEGRDQLEFVGCEHNYKNGTLVAPLMTPMHASANGNIHVTSQVTEDGNNGRFRRIRTYPAAFHVYPTEKAARKGRFEYSYISNITILKVNVSSIVAEGTDYNKVPTLVVRDMTIVPVGHVKEQAKAANSIIRAARRRLL